LRQAYDYWQDQPGNYHPRRDLSSTLSLFSPERERKGKEAGHQAYKMLIGREVSLFWLSDPKDERAFHPLGLI